MTPCRVLVDPPASGAWNMAVDEALLEQTRITDVPVFRLYGWEEATLSLGYFQPSAAAEPFFRLPLVRRLSGGGAIVHHHEITYSLCLPPGHSLAAKPNRLYRKVHEGLAGALGTLGVTLDRRGMLPNSPEQRPDGPFLCFLRQSPDNLMLDGSKVVGSAQRRRRGALLQHGSVILATSPHAPDVIGLQELAGVAFPFSTARELFVQAVLRSLGLHAEPASMEEPERELAAHLASSKYSSRRWNCRR